MAGTTGAVPAPTLDTHLRILELFDQGLRAKDITQQLGTGRAITYWVINRHRPASTRTHTWRRTVPNPIPEPQLSWVAGILEGEGSFSHSRPGKPHVGVEMTDKDVLDRLAAICGGGVTGPYKRHATNRKPTWAWRVADTNAVRLMVQVRPHMLSRRQARIDELLEQAA